MKKNSNKKIKTNGGAAMLISVVFFLFISLAIIYGLGSPSIHEFRNASASLNSKQSYFLAESGVEDAIYRISNNLSLDVSEALTLQDKTVTTTVSTLAGNVKQIVSLGSVNSRERQTTVMLKTGDGEVFKYGTQAGQGGFIFHNNSYLNGNVFSNGNIVGSNGAYVTGDAYVAGSSGSISNMRVGYGGTGDAQAHTVTDSTITGTIYCQNGTGNNKACNTSRSDPEPEDMPISEEDILKWKTDAADGGITNGNVTISGATTLGPRKIDGNLTINSTLTVANTIYVTGNVIINGTVKLAGAYGATSGIIVADGYIIIGNGVVFQDSGTPGSYILFLSTSTCDASISGSPCNGNNAIEVNNNSDISIVNAQEGTIYFSNNSTVKEAAAKKIELKNNVGINYGSGLINVNFTSGPSGAWVIDSWAETK